MPNTKRALVRIRYCAFNPTSPEQDAQLRIEGRQPSAASRWIPVTADPTRILDVLEAIFEATNLQEGELWAERIEPRLPAGRTHTSLSSNRFGGGDELDVYVDHTLRTFRCDPVGWSVLTDDTEWHAIVPPAR